MDEAATASNARTSSEAEAARAGCDGVGDGGPASAAPDSGSIAPGAAGAASDTGKPTPPALASPLPPVGPVAYGPSGDAGIEEVIVRIGGGGGRQAGLAGGRKLRLLPLEPAPAPALLLLPAAGPLMLAPAAAPLTDADEGMLYTVVGSEDDPGKID